MRLKLHDLEVLNATLLELHAKPDLETLHCAMPGMLLRVVAAEYAQVVEYAADAGSRSVKALRAWESRPLMNEDLRRRFELLLPEHPFTRQSRFTGKLAPSLLSDFWTLRQFRQTRLYSELYRPVGFARHLAASVNSSAAPAALSLMRAEGARDFDACDRMLVGVLHQHYDQARRRLTARAARDRDAAATPARLGLTAREAEVAAWMARGKSNTEIASILGMGLRTAEKHVEHILQKLGVDNRTAASLLLNAPPNPEG